jgi:membrane fusion protein, multidrug efflux system
MNKVNKYLSIDSIKNAYSDKQKRKKFWIGAAILFALIILYPKAHPLISEIPIFQQEETETKIQADGIIIQTERLDSSISATGTLRAIQEVDLSVEVSGKIIDLRIEEGSEVERGQLLVKVNDNDLQAEKSRLESNIEVLEESQRRQQQLFERGGATQEDYDNTLMQLNNVQAELASVEVQIDRTEVNAPFDGIVGLTYISDGAYVTPSTRIASLQDMSSMRVDFSIPERYSSSVMAGNTIRFEVQGVDSLFTGQVIAAEPQIDPRTRTIQIRAVTDNSDRLLNPGAFANVELILTSIDNATMVPAVSLIPDDGRYKVMVFENGIVHERFVTTGVRTQNNVHVTEGLETGEIILVNALQQVNDGDPVEIRTIQN